MTNFGTARPAAGKPAPRPVMTHTHNYLYYRLKRRSRKPSFALDIGHGLMLLVFFPVDWLFALVDAVNPHSQGVITACFEKTTC
jgi:hypothetical protein